MHPIKIFYFSLISVIPSTKMLKGEKEKIVDSNSFFSLLRFNIKSSFFSYLC